MKAFFKALLYQPLFNILIFLVWLMPNNNLGLAIIAITVIMRIIFLPSSIKQGESQEKLRILQPKIKELQEKHKGDKAAQSKAMIDLYKQAGTSPWGACLPLIVQLGVLILLYRVFQIGLTTERFDLLYAFVPRPEYINTTFLGIDLSKPELWFLPITAGVAQFIQSKLAMPAKQPKAKPDDNPMAMATGQMVYIFPIVTIFIGRSLPAALLIYWVTTSLFMVGQQIYINRVVKPRVDQQLAHLKPSEILAIDQEKPAKKEDKKKVLGKGVSVTIRKKKNG
jgi:YidC/Oxa1 family membrane protein insertase